MSNNSKAQNISREVLTLYIIHTYFCPDYLYHEIYRDYYWRAWGVNLDLCPREVIAHCEWLKQNPNRLFYHYHSKDRTEQEHLDALDIVINELKEGS